MIVTLSLYREYVNKDGKYIVVTFSLHSIVREQTREQTRQLHERYIGEYGNKDGNSIIVT
jgi:hypothetical protein